MEVEDFDFSPATLGYPAPEEGPKTPPRTRYRDATASPSTHGCGPSPKKRGLYVNPRWPSRKYVAATPDVGPSLKDLGHFAAPTPSPPRVPRQSHLPEIRSRRFNPLHWSTRSGTPGTSATKRSSIAHLIRSFGGIKVEKKTKRTKLHSNELETVAATAAGSATDLAGDVGWSPLRRAWRRTTPNSTSSPPLPHPLDSSSTSSQSPGSVAAPSLNRQDSDEGLGGSFVLLPSPVIDGDGNASSSMFGDHYEDEIEAEAKNQAIIGRLGRTLAERLGGGLRSGARKHLRAGLYT
ncbi:hypothetical protein FRC04_005195 [Tulasnella sp. 424]|nr:hypothetical protein FRC04_005195 [Tulasnella sp. 424]KAG8960253.1 hypothetical protein FRC05_007038 [Tulasnella sp. 425]